MHAVAHDTGRLFFETYWRPSYTRILDVGSMDVNGTLRDVVPSGAQYTGVDLEEGPGVDMVLVDPHRFPFPDSHFQVVVSTSCFEHDDMFWLTFLEMCRVLSDDGVIYINVPASGPYHGYPRDYWRFYPDAASALARWGQRMLQPIRLVESFHYEVGYTSFRDYVGVFTKTGAKEQAEFLSDKLIGVNYIRKGDGTLQAMDSSF